MPEGRGVGDEDVEVAGDLVLVGACVRGHRVGRGWGGVRCESVTVERGMYGVRCTVYGER